MTHDSRLSESRDEGLRAGPDDVGSSHRQGDYAALFVLALALGLGVGAVLLALLTRKHLFARQIAPADSPIQVV